MNELIIGVVGTSKKKGERRIPIHPQHLSRIPQHIRNQMIFEEGYGAPFDILEQIIISFCINLP